jgi:hypothetical protein
MDHQGASGRDPNGKHGRPLGGQHVVLDEGTMRILEAVNLVMRQQQAAQRREALATKALHSIVNRLDQFDGWNVLKYIRFYIQVIELNRVFEEEIVASFELTVIPEIREWIQELQASDGNIGGHLFKH